MVKRIIDRHGLLNPAEIKKTKSIASSPASLRRRRQEIPRYEEIRHILENSPCFGNDIDDVDLVARQCALIYCQEVEKYTNPRGGRFVPVSTRCRRTCCLVKT